MFSLINLIDRTIFNIDTNLTKYLKNKKYFADSCKATIIIEVIIIVVNCFKNFFCQSKYI